VLTAGATLVLIFAGGVVTNTGSGLAVPDWPTTFGHNMFLYPWSQMVGGIFIEHSHRLIGSVVGMLTVGLGVWLWVSEPRRWVQFAGLAAVVAVVIQGVLGGLRVVLLEHGLAIVHGCFAHAFLALIVALAVWTGRRWRDDAADTLGDTRGARGLALFTTAAVYVQVVLGALVTHTGAYLISHIAVALLVVLSASLLATRVLRAPGVELRRPAIVLLALLALQVGLGVGAFAWRFTALNEVMAPGLGLAFQTIHRLTGATILAASVVLMLRVLRRPAPHTAPAGAALTGLRGREVPA
jgi:cytochrome c oxidase assembly protein subunit 15